MTDPGPQLPLQDYRRYGRQMILNGFGLEGQLKLRRASVVVVGAGGLGCPALQYLAAAGIGTIGIVDHDTVELSNLQRQVLHTESRVGMFKALSAAEAIKQMNYSVAVNPTTTAITAANAADLLGPYDLILDCTDNLPTRYLLSDTAVRLGKPLVSGAAQQFEGQLCTYNLAVRPNLEAKAEPSTCLERGPCFRCLFPRPPAPDMAGSCEVLGVLGAVTGVIGNLQALEAIKIITGLHDGKPSLLMFSALGAQPFRSIKLRTRKATCPACGSEGEKVGRIEEMDYIAFCGGERPDWVSKGLMGVDAENRIRARDLKEKLEDTQQPVWVVDVRPRTEYSICHLPGSTNIPVKELLADPTSSWMETVPENADIYVVCRLGNDSQLAVDALRAAGRGGIVKDLVGGLRAWAREADVNFPVY